MKRIAIIILLLLGSRYEGYCQFIESAGPNSTALAGLNANNADVWSINYNVGQLQNLERSSGDGTSGLNTNLAGSQITLRVKNNPLNDVGNQPAESVCVMFLHHSIALVLRNNAIQVSI